MAYNPIAKNLSNVTTAATIEVPAGVMVQDVVIKSNNANAVLGGVKIGTTAGATDVLASVAVNGNTISAVPNASLTKQVFSMTAPQTLFVDAVTSFNSASLDMNFIMVKLK